MAKIIACLFLILWFTACLSKPPELPIPSLTPSERKTLLNNQWRLTEVVYNGVQGDFDSISPVLATFDADSLTLRGCNSKSLIFEAVSDNTKEYKLIDGVGTLKSCANDGNKQEGFIQQALIETNDYEFARDTLVLFGENARVTFVIDNEATKPPE